MQRIQNFTNSDRYRAAIHDLIPGGAHTYSKGDDQFPALAPAAISHGKDGWVWDIDGNKFLDCSMGLTSVSLGHAYQPVVDRVIEEVRRGVNFQRPSYLEKEMAEQFLALIPFHDMVKFAKNGSTVTTAAVKLARAYTGRDLVAFPHDHPFYSYDDWFISQRECHRGIPEPIRQLSVTYKADDIESLRALFAKYPGQIACVISEPEKQMGIPEGYLQQAIDLAHREGALYVADEMVTGYKTALPGSITKYGAEPDMACWGKGIANGFSFTALTGKKEVMELGGIRRTGEEKVFLISTTHGGETHGIAAGLATIKEFTTRDVLGHNQGMGDYFLQTLNEVIASRGMQDYIDLWQSNWMPTFVFKNNQGEIDNGMRTLMLQEMIARGVLFQGIFIPCFTHTREDVQFFASAFDDSITTFKKALDEGYEKYLVGEPTKNVFRKYL
ncbi:MAG: glutamate-1-semialdehyde 2,1-aminomutase [Bacteroidia bacterium]|nr:glutamate-1-semialdehyde 2,1-aminomutase [Bacteroidia bacterium]